MDEDLSVGSAEQELVNDWLILDEEFQMHLFLIAYPLLYLLIILKFLSGEQDIYSYMKMPVQASHHNLIVRHLGEGETLQQIIA